jgi:hypothetical protein
LFCQIKKLCKLEKVAKNTIVITSDAVYKVVDDDDVKVLFEELNDGVGADVAAASSHKHRLAAARHDEAAAVGLKKRNLKSNYIKGKFCVCTCVCPL